MMEKLGSYAPRFLKTGGALNVGFSFAGVPLTRDPARGDIAGPPDPDAVDYWRPSCRQTQGLFRKCEAPGHHGLLRCRRRWISTEQLSAVARHSFIRSGAPVEFSTILAGRRASRCCRARRRCCSLRRSAGEQPAASSSQRASSRRASPRAPHLCALIGDKRSTSNDGHRTGEPPALQVGRQSCRASTSGRRAGILAYRSTRDGHAARTHRAAARQRAMARAHVGMWMKARLPPSGARRVSQGRFIGVAPTRMGRGEGGRSQVVWAEGPNLPRNPAAMTHACGKTTDTVIDDYGDPAQLRARLACCVGNVLWPLPGTHTVLAQLRSRRCQRQRSAHPVRDAERLCLARRARSGLGAPRR